MRDLTDNELRVLKLTADGLTNEQVAQRIYVSSRTVKGVLHAVREALGVHTTVHAVSVAYRTGLPAGALSIEQAKLLKAAHALGYDLALIPRKDRP